MLEVVESRDESQCDSADSLESDSPECDSPECPESVPLGFVLGLSAALFVIDREASSSEVIIIIRLRLLHAFNFSAN